MVMVILDVFSLRKKGLFEEVLGATKYVFCRWKTLLDRFHLQEMIVLVIQLHLYRVKEHWWLKFLSIPVCSFQGCFGVIRWEGKNRTSKPPTDPPTFIQNSKGPLIY